MPISEEQLETWSHIGSIRQSSETYNDVKNTLESAGTPYSAKNFTVFLQGSYGNDTNVFSESDVDIVICLNEIFYSDLDDLPEEQQAAYSATFPDAAYALNVFKADVIKTLEERYGADVESGSKAITIAARGRRRKADVIVSAQFRRYHHFRSFADSSYVEGICFFNSTSQRIANYPRQHSANLTSAHGASNEWLKPMVRVLKNLRNRLVNDGVIDQGLAPSYYIEGLLYNVPGAKFSHSYQDCFVNVMTWYLNEAKKENFLCPNEQYYLLRDGSIVCWPPAHCDVFMNNAIEFWNNQ